LKAEKDARLRGNLEPLGKARGSSMKYPPAPMDARASARYPPVAESAVALARGRRHDLVPDKKGPSKNLRWPENKRAMGFITHGPSLERVSRL